MKGITVAHSKIKNTGLLFEVLVRQITSDTLEGRPTSHALDLLQKYFGAQRELGKELQLYQAVLNTNKLSESRALQFLDMVLHQRKTLDEKKLAHEKYDLIREIQEHYDLKTFMSCKIPSYKLHASIYKTFLTEARHSKDTILNIQDVASARFALLEHLLGTNAKQETKESALLEEFKNQTEDLRLLTYKILIDRFNEKYEGLDDKQKNLLREYINDISSQTTLYEYVRREVPALQQELKKKIGRVQDRIIQIKLTEVASQLGTIGKKKVIKDSEITAMMVAYQIVKEIENVA